MRESQVVQQLKHIERWRSLNTLNERSCWGGQDCFVCGTAGSERPKVTFTKVGRSRGTANYSINARAFLEARLNFECSST